MPVSDRLLGGFERDPPALQFVDDVLQVLHGAREPVDAGDDQRVAFAQEVEQDLEFGPRATLGTRLLLGADRLASGRA